MPGIVGIVLAALVIGVGVAVVTPLGFAMLASARPPERLGQAMGSAEVGRELGDAGGPLLAGAVATAASAGGGFVALAVLLEAPAIAVSTR